MAGEAEQTLPYLNEALRLTEHRGEAWFAAEVQRQIGEAYRQLGNASVARKSFENALSIARHQNAKLWELRAAMSLARLLRNQGRTGEAYKLVAPVFGFFTEGFGTNDLKDAKFLLGELQDTSGALIGNRLDSNPRCS